jgi:hypothetical protein
VLDHARCHFLICFSYSMDHNRLLHSASFILIGFKRNDCRDGEDQLVVGVRRALMVVPTLYVVSARGLSLRITL